VPVPVFCCFCSEKLLRKYSRNWTKINGGPYFTDTSTESKGETEKRQEAATPCLGAAHPLPRRGVVWAPRVASDAALSPIYSSRLENRKYPSHIPRKVPEPPSSSTLAREGSEALPDTLPERGIITGGLYIAMPASRVMRE